MILSSIRSRASVCALLAFAGLTNVAAAADLPSRYPVKAPVNAYYDWSGFYVGVNAGYGVGSSAMTTTFTPAIFGGYQLGMGPSGWLGGVQFGYNWQAGPWVLGVEGDLQAAALKDGICFDFCGVLTFNVEQKLPWFATVRGRVGYAAGPVLLYGTAGAAFTTIKTSLTAIDGPTVSQSFNDARAGWTVGAGIETALSGGWSAKLEYLYMDFGSISHSIPDPFLGASNPNVFSFDVREQLVRLGLNYRFNARANEAAVAFAGPATNWTGFYVGGNLGGVAAHGSSATLSDFGTSDQSTLNARSVAGGVQAGFNWQLAQWVLGAEFDYQAANLSQADCGSFCLPAQYRNLSSKMSWFATARGRIGYAVGPSLYYATGGAAMTRVSTDYVDYDSGTVFASGNFSDSRTGWALGGGIETALSGNWSAKAEYLYLDFGSITHMMPIKFFGGNEGFSAHISDHLFRLGVNYRFAGGR